MYHSNLRHIDFWKFLQDEEQPLSLSEIKLELGAVERGWAKKEGPASAVEAKFRLEFETDVKHWTILGFWDQTRGVGGEDLSPILKPRF